ncbi:SusD/RagB family nutrient-binding outer membrane lipoprotein [Flavobacterium faecale]|uniref:SusD/RagB family nutrient-binding outer membrane lipoprotein n=1 Tax=Flavobacterium faecale TaxID=1355330 RepID=UPI003AAD6474
MKLLINKKNLFYKMIVFLGTLLFTVGCSDYLDVNTDTDNPKTAPLDLLLTKTQVNLSKVGDFDIYSGSVLEVYTHQMTTREDHDQYNNKPDNIFLSNDWGTVYLTLTDIETLIQQSEASGNLAYLGIAQMQKAYLIACAVDLWGDVPYSEATQLKNNIISPKFDNQKEIYKSVFNLIETAKTNLGSAQTAKKPGKDDLFYGGDTAKWIRFANTFKLKLYNQTRLTNDFDQLGFDALVLENNFFTSNADDFQFTHTANVAPSDERNRYFYQSYNSTQFEAYQSPWFYEILMGMNPNIHNGNPDPRIPYYFFNQLKSGVLPPDQGDKDTNNPKADYWDSKTGFFSIRFGSVGPYKDSSAENSYTYPGIFPAGGRYDDGQGGIMSSTTATGIAPHRILTYDEFLYIEAELMHATKLSGNPGAKLKEAIEASFAKVDQVVKNNKSTQVIPVLVGSSAVNTYIDNIMTEYNSASASKKLEIIMTQKWIATYGDPLDQYNDYRRTGYPILANPNSTTREYQLDNGDGFPLIDSQTVLNSPYQVSFFWPQSELNVNRNSPQQKNPATYKIFWDVD